MAIFLCLDHLVLGLVTSFPGRKRVWQLHSAPVMWLSSDL